ncbi:flagellar export chaperone FliS [Salidesulfovibrio onnuriiensis]|uniref:flagellar export chaperone FliS n=1 Tax=Salidesulfovibrio onnuriiensis TaxID=2583823 RepID=UPI0011C83F0E|nr:flagellar export chaperone FliS [Salidesulfovibrio onnuriiensis]
MSNPAKAYLTTQVETTTQGELLLMLYEAAIKFLKRAKIEMEKKDYAQKGIYISKAMDVISELADSLNKEKGGKITENLHSLYTFCNFHLAKANLKMDMDKIDEVIKIIDGIRSAYAQIVPQVEKGISPDAAKQAAAPAPGPTPAQAQQPIQQAPMPPKADPAPAAQPAQAESQSTPEPKAAAARPKPAAPKPQPGAPEPTKAAPKPMVNPTRLRATNAYSNSR